MVKDSAVVDPFTLKPPRRRLLQGAGAITPALSTGIRMATRCCGAHQPAGGWHSASGLAWNSDARFHRVTGGGGLWARQLFPYSDIDLLVLLPGVKNGADAVDDAIESRLEHWVRLLWDIGLEVGHSVRTLAECAEEARKDITVQTSLLEARQLAGHRQLFSEFSHAMQADA